MVVWLIKQGGFHEGLLGFLSGIFEEWVGWDSPAAPGNGEWAGRSWGQWFYSCLKWGCSEQSTRFPRKSGAMGASLGWVSFHCPPFWLEQKYPKTFLLAWQCAAHWSGSFRYCQIKIIIFPVSQSVINESQSHWKSWGTFHCVSTTLYLCLKLWVFIVPKTSAM